MSEMRHFYLQNLQNSVGQREGLIAELRRLAEPLTNSCDPEVAAQLNAQVDEAVIAWNDTRKNLYNITNKYKGAVNLWKKYREGRDDIRRWIEHQWGNLDLLQDKPEAVLPQIKVTSSMIQLVVPVTFNRSKTDYYMCLMPDYRHKFQHIGKHLLFILFGLKGL